MLFCFTLGRFWCSVVTSVTLVETIVTLKIIQKISKKLLKSQKKLKGPKIRKQNQKNLHKIFLNKF